MKLYLFYKIQKYFNFHPISNYLNFEYNFIYQVIYQSEWKINKPIKEKEV